MKTAKYYVAIIHDKDKGYTGYICRAHSKKQMKERGMNMRLDWVRYNTRNEAVVQTSDCEQIKETNLA